MYPLRGKSRLLRLSQGALALLATLGYEMKPRWGKYKSRTQFRTQNLDENARSRLEFAQQVSLNTNRR